MTAKTDIWMPLYIGDYLAATTHLSAEESGAYLHLLMHQWKNGELPAEFDSLRRIARVDKDAWSIVWASLKHFFSMDGAFPIQLRLEEIRAEWQAKKTAAVKKAEEAAAKRWKDHPKNAPSIAPSNAQAMPQSCPSSSSSPLPIKKQKPSRAKREGGLSDERHIPFKLAFEVYYRHRTSKPAPWDGREGKALDVFLAANPTWLLSDWQAMLQNRGRSDVAHGESLSRWISLAAAFAHSPLDRFGKPKEPASATPNKFLNVEEAYG